MMPLPEFAFYAAAACSISITIAMTLHFRKKEKATLAVMHEMLDKAINNQFTETTYDETSLSALACKLNRFLKTSKLAEQNILAERAKIKEFVSDISHQTKTPLSNILLYTQLLQEQQGLPEQAQQAAGAISAQSEKLNFLIQSLVKVSRLESGMLIMNPQIASVLALITDATESIAQKAKSKNITLELICAEDLQACFDAKWTGEALANILDNAAKYTPAGGFISASAAAGEVFTHIDIKDNGIGIAKKDINRIFQRFYRSQTVSQFEGVGIGLYLAREILSAEGGYIKVNSEPGKGSTFSVFLPNQA